MNYVVTLTDGKSLIVENVADLHRLDNAFYFFNDEGNIAGYFKEETINSLWTYSENTGDEMEELNDGKCLLCR